MTNGPERPFPGSEFPASASSPPAFNPYPPVDYPGGPGLPPPYPPPYAGGYGYGGYGPDPYDPYRPAKPLGTNGKAIASLATSLAGLVFCGLPSIVGLILGVIAMRETRRSGQDGYGLALAGVIVGGLVTAGLVFYMLFVIGVAASGWSLV